MTRMITKSHKDVLNERSGVFSKHDVSAVELMDMKLIDATPIPFDRYSWVINDNGLVYVDVLEDSTTE